MSHKFTTKRDFDCLNYQSISPTVHTIKILYYILIFTFFWIVLNSVDLELIAEISVFTSLIWASYFLPFVYNVCHKYKFHNLKNANLYFLLHGKIFKLLCSSWIQSIFANVSFCFVKIYRNILSRHVITLFSYYH